MGIYRRPSCCSLIVSDTDTKITIKHVNFAETSGIVPIRRAMALKTGSSHDASFVVTYGTAGCCYVVTDDKVGILTTLMHINIFIHAGIILCIPPANERRCYNMTSPLIGWAHSQNDPWGCTLLILLCSVPNQSQQLTH